MRSYKFANRCHGITLLELMIVVAIVGILAGIAYPAYQQSLINGRRPTASIALQHCAAEQERFYSRNFTYSLAVPQCNGFVQADGSMGAATGAYYQISVAACGAGIQACYAITATAVGQQTVDTDCPQYTLNSLGVRTPDIATTRCWK